MVLLKELSLMHKGDLSNTAEDNEVDEKAANEVRDTFQDIKKLFLTLMRTLPIRNEKNLYNFYVLLYFFLLTD